MAITNSWEAMGVVQLEPKLMKLSEDKLMCRTVFAVGIEHRSAKAYLPVAAYNKRAHIFAQLVHKGAVVYCKGIIQSHESITKEQTKVLVGVTFKITDFVVLVKEPVATTEISFADVVQLYNPENFMKEEEEENVE